MPRGRHSGLPGRQFGGSRDTFQIDDLVCRGRSRRKRGGNRHGHAAYAFRQAPARPAAACLPAPSQRIPAGFDVGLAQTEILGRTLEIAGNGLRVIDVRRQGRDIARQVVAAEP